MCDPTAVGILIATAEAAVIVASVLLGFAILTSSNFWTSGGSPALLVGAGVAVAVAAIALGAALGQVVACSSGLSPGCDRTVNDLLGILGGLLASLAPLGLAIGIGAAGTAVPFAGSVVAAALLVAALLQIAAFNVLSPLYGTFVACKVATPPPVTGTIGTVLSVFGVVGTIGAIFVGGGTIAKFPKDSGDRGR